MLLPDAWCASTILANILKSPLPTRSTIWAGYRPNLWNYILPPDMNIYMYIHIHVYTNIHLHIHVCEYIYIYIYSTWFPPTHRALASFHPPPTQTRCVFAGTRILRASTDPESSQFYGGFPAPHRHLLPTTRADLHTHRNIHIQLWVCWYRNLYMYVFL